MIECFDKPIIKHVPINGSYNDSLIYAVMINPQQKKYQLISDGNKIKCVIN